MEIKREVAITVKINGIEVKATVSPEESLLAFLRDRVGSFDVVNKEIVVPAPWFLLVKLLNLAWF